MPATLDYDITDISVNGEYVVSASVADLKGERVARNVTITDSADLDAFLSEVEMKLGAEAAGIMRGKLRKHAATEAENDEFGLLVTRLADVTPVDREWLWQNRVPLKRITGVVGKPGEGKSVLTLCMSSHVSRGISWPDGASCDPGRVLLVSCEDGVPDDLVPRLIVNGADLSMIDHITTAVDTDDSGHSIRRMFTLYDVGRIEKLISGNGYRLIVIDPIGSYVGGSTDTHRDNEVRSVLAPVAEMADRCGVAVIVVMHTRKSRGDSADDTALGSRAFSGIARAMWHVSTDQLNVDRRLFLPGKNNSAKPNGGLGFVIESATPPGLRESQPRIVWESQPVQMTADEHLAATQDGPGPEPAAREAAEVWLLDLLTVGEREVGMDDAAEGTIRGEAKAAGISWGTVRRAKDALAAKGRVIRSERNPFSKRYQWRLVAQEK